MHRRIVAACVWLGACLFPSLDGLSGSDGDGGGDAMLDGTVDAPVDTGADTSADAGADAITDVVVAQFACAKVDAKFCDDFDDEDAGPFAHWTSSYSGAGAYFARAPSDASAPTASQFESFGWKDGSAPYAILEKDFVASITSSARLSFDLRVDQWPTTTTAYFNTGDLAFGANGGGTNLVIRQNASALQETIPTDAGTQYPSHTLTMNPVLGVWLHVDEIWTFTPNAITIEIRFDGKTALAPLTLDPRHKYGVPTMRIGETYADLTNDRANFLMDNVVFDFQ